MKTSPRHIACLLGSLALLAGSALAAPTIPAPVAFTVAAPETKMTSARMKELAALFTKTIAGAATSARDKTTAFEFLHLILEVQDSNPIVTLSDYHRIAIDVFP